MLTSSQINISIFISGFTLSLTCENTMYTGETCALCELCCHAAMHISTFMHQLLLPSCLTTWAPLPCPDPHAHVGNLLECTAHQLSLLGLSMYIWFIVWGKPFQRETKPKWHGNNHTAHSQGENNRHKTELIYQLRSEQSQHLLWKTCQGADWPCG